MKQPTKTELLAFARQIARLTKDRECETCGLYGDDDNPACEDHEPFDMPNDDAVEALHSLISQARDMIGDVREPVEQKPRPWDGPTAWQGEGGWDSVLLNSPRYTSGPYALVADGGGWAVFHERQRLGWGQTFHDAQDVATRDWAEHRAPGPKLCPYHRESLAGQFCYIGFSGCEVLALRKAQEEE